MFSLSLPTILTRTCLLAAAFLSIPIYAQKRPPSAQDVHEIAQRVDHHYNQPHSLKSQFTQTYEGLGIHRSESGTLFLLKPGRMKWDYTTPSG